jgi:hypothetical protein
MSMEKLMQAIISSLIRKLCLGVNGAMCVTWISANAASYRVAEVLVVVREDAPAMVKLAADEVRGYAYRLTGVYPPMAVEPAADRPAIVLRTGPGDRLPVGGPDPSQNFALYPEGATQIVHGASDSATFWAAYQLIESWGRRLLSRRGRIA